MKQRWYVIAVEPQMDAIVAAKLRRPDPMSGRPEFEVIWPYFKVSKIRHGAVVEEPESMFPGYLFFRGDCRPEAPQHWVLIKTKVRGVAGMLPRSSQYPIPVPDEIIKLLQRCTVGGEARLSSDQLVKALDRYFKDGTLILDEPEDDPFGQVGQILSIIDGPFANRNGKCIAADHQTATVIVSIFGRDTNVTILQSHIGAEKWLPAQDVDRPKRKAYIRRQEKRVASS